ncbi:MAG TPA: DegV family protein [Gaiellaceae bacterium]|nr:DegV family protein [Gaiellaceae bacterium]
MQLNLQNTAIVLDSTADLPDVGHRPNWGVVPLYVRFGDDVYRDYVDMQPPEFYARLRATKEQPRSSQPSPGDFERAAGDLGAYERVLILSISSGLSGTYESARTAADADASRRLRAFDTGFVSGAIVLLAEAIQRRLARGTDDEEIAELVARFRSDAHFVLTVETLEYLVRGGRAGRAAALAGTLASLKPILEVSGGEIVPVGRVRGRARSLEELLRIFLRETEDDASIRVGLVHADAEHELETLAARVRDARPNVSHEFRGMFGPVLGTNAGPGAIAVCWFRDSG